jgi:hypothetical protein
MDLGGARRTGGRCCRDEEAVQKEIIVRGNHPDCPLRCEGGHSAPA